LPARIRPRLIVFAGILCAGLASGVAVTPKPCFYGGSSDIAPHEIHLIDAGLALEFSGGMGPGSAEELNKMLNDNPAVQVLHLNSPGGLVGEARMMFGLIQHRQLITTSDRYCFSACTLAFLAGRQRYLAPGARLGFHSESSDFADESHVEAFEGVDKQTMLSLGIPSDFIDKAFATPKDQIWIPKISQLEDARFIDGVSRDYLLDGDAESGPAQADTSAKASSTAHAGGSDLPAVEETPGGVTIYRGPGQ
jgi:hypothetical protein